MLVSRRQEAATAARSASFAGRITVANAWGSPSSLAGRGKWRRATGTLKWIEPRAACTRAGFSRSERTATSETAFCKSGDVGCLSYVASNSVVGCPPIEPSSRPILN